MQDAQWQKAAHLSWHLRDSGVSVLWNDVLIASMALHPDCAVYTLDGHCDLISKVSGLGLYKPGYGGKCNPG